MVRLYARYVGIAAATLALLGAAAASACTSISHSGSGTLEGSLDAADCLAGEILGGVDASRADVYEIQLTVRTELTATLESADFDAFLVIVDATGNRLAEDDDSHGNLNATVSLTLDPGTFRIVANSATTVMETGTYQLTLNTTGLETPSRLVNISTRGVARAADEVMIGGLVIAGNSPKRVLIRGVGPSLEAFGVTSTLADPQLSLFTGTTLVASNNNCADHTRASEIPQRFYPTHVREACIVANLEPGPHTAILQGSGDTGVGLIELYELDTGQRLINLSTRGPVGTGDEVLIGGLVISGTTPQTVVIRAIGPSLAAHGVGGVLENPQIAVYRGADLIHSNTNWASAENAGLLPGHLIPDDPGEAALVLTLEPGAYTAIVSGEGGTTGIALVEVYEQ